MYGFSRTNEVHYIGGSDVLPAPLAAQEEARMLENLERRDRTSGRGQKIG